MSALFRETAAGKLIHFLGKGSILRYPEEEPGFVIPDSLLHPPSAVVPTSQSPSDESTLADVEAQREKSKTLPLDAPVSSSATDAPIIVGWYSDTDPDMPHNWGALKKSVTLTVLCILTFGVYVGSSLIVSGFGGLIEEFGVGEEKVTVTLSLYVICYGIGALLFSPLSEIPAYGRNPFYWAPMIAMVVFQVGAWRVKTFTGLVLLRGLTALCGSPVLSTGAATVADIFNPMQIPVMLSIWIVPAFAAPAVGPVFGNFAAQANGWRWTMLELLWIIGFVTILLLFVMPETSHANILLRRAERLRKLTGNPNLKSQSEIDAANKTPGMVFREAIVRPFQITILDPSIGFVNLYTGIIYGSYYLFFDAFPIVYGEIYHFSFGAQGVAYLTIAVGAIAGFIAYVIYQMTYMKNYYMTKGWPVNEKRLEPAIVSSVFAVIGLFIFAWSSRPSAHWSGSLIGSGVFVAANFVTFQCVFFYIVLSYPQYAASLFAANDFIRASFASGLLHAGTPMFRALGIDGGVSFLGGLSILGVVGISAIYYYGARLRAKSRFAVGDGA